MRDAVMTFLDALGLVLVAAGLAAGSFRWLGWGCVAVAGVVVLSGSVFASMRPAGDVR